MTARTNSRRRRITGSRRVVRSLVVLAVAALVWAAGPAMASAADLPEMVVTGEPTADESARIRAVWDRLSLFFAAQAGCIEPLEVQVVDRAEDFYGGRSFGPIAAFYRDSDPAIVFVEHGKVNPGTLIHEFAHHLDLSCGVGAGRLGAAIREAQGLPADSSWTAGRTWREVPAEVFAESVAAVFGEPTSLPVSDEARLVVWSLARTPLEDPSSGLPLGAGDGGELARVCFTPTGVIGAL